MIKHYNIRIFGQVTGVNFRSAAKQQARQLALTGFAKNESGGSVYIEAEGDDANLQAFIAWCKAGTRWSKVERVEVSEGALKNFLDFKVIWSIYGSEF